MTVLIEYSVLLSALIWVVIVSLPWRPWSVRERLEPDSVISRQHPDLSDITVLIPARNEAEHIAATIHAVQLQGSGHRIIVIDDQSRDATAELARQAGAEVIHGTRLPAGWTGKLWALQQGLQQVRTPLILQLDADIQLQPGMLARLLHHQQTHAVSLVSIMALLPTATFWQTLLLPAYVWFFKMLYPFALVNGQLNDWRSRFAAAAGGCILLTTDALRTSGEYTALKSAVIDDCSLAGRIKAAGYPIWIGLSHGVLSHRASATLPDVAQLVARTAYTQLRYSIGLLLITSVLLIIVFWAPLTGLLIDSWITRGAAVLCLLLMTICYWPLMRFYQLNRLSGLWLPLTATLYLGMTWLSAWQHWSGRGARWKGRHYSA